MTVGGAPATKASRLVDPGEPVEVGGDPPRFVGRGGEKLDAALQDFALDVRGSLTLDAGASTGGFTDCLLQRGAARVVAVDVGYGQLHPRLRDDERVEVRERTNVRDLSPEAFSGAGLDVAGFDVVVADLSFISLRTVASVLVGLARTGGDLVLLVKPQFEAGRAEASRGAGVIRDPAVWARVLDEVRERYEEHGAAMMGLMVSPLRGAEGNVEFLAHLRKGPSGEAGGRPDIASVVADASADD